MICVVCREDFDPSLQPGAIFLTEPRPVPGGAPRPFKLHLCSMCGTDVEQYVLTPKADPRPDAPYKDVELEALNQWLRMFDGRPIYLWLLTVLRLRATVRLLKGM